MNIRARLALYYDKISEILLSPDYAVLSTIARMDNAENGASMKKANGRIQQSAISSFYLNYCKSEQRD